MTQQMCKHTFAMSIGYQNDLFEKAEWNILENGMDCSEHMMNISRSPKLMMTDAFGSGPRPYQSLVKQLKWKVSFTNFSNHPLLVHVGQIITYRYRERSLQLK